MRLTTARTLFAIASVLLTLAGAAPPAAAFRAPELSPQQQKALRDNFALCVGKLKGPYTENFCVCPDGRKIAGARRRGQVGIPCKDALFCAAYRAPWAEALAKEGVYIGNIFSRDLYLWDTFPDHNDLVRGYILEKYFVETNPKHKLASCAPSAACPAPSTRPRPPRASSSATSPRPSSTTRATSCSPTSCRGASSSATTSARSRRSAPWRCASRQRPHVQAAARRGPQSDVGRPDPAARRRTATSCRPARRRDQVDQLIARSRKLTAIDERALAAQVREIEDAACASSCARWCRPPTPTRSTRSSRSARS